MRSTRRRGGGGAVASVDEGERRGGFPSINGEMAASAVAVSVCVRAR